MYSYCLMKLMCIAYFDMILIISQDVEAMPSTWGGKLTFANVSSIVYVVRW